MNIEGLTLFFLTQELNDKLSGGRISKIFQPTRFQFMLKINHHPVDLNLSISMDPTNPHVHLVDSTPENPLEPSAFCMYLRKHLVDGKITAIEQQAGLDRVIHFQIDRREERGQINTKTFSLELAGKNCNFILSQTGIVLDAFRRVSTQNSRVRQIWPGSAYVPPPAPVRLDPLITSGKELVERLTQLPSQKLSKALLNTTAGLGPPSVSEVLFRAEIPEQEHVDRLSDDQLKKLADVFDAIMNPLRSRSLSVCVALDSAGALLHLAPYSPTFLNAAVVKTFSTVLAAITYSAALAPAPKTSRQKEMLRKIRSEQEKLEKKLILLQKEELASHGADELKQQADLLMANLYRLEQGMRSIAVEDIYAGSSGKDFPVRLVELDPALSPMANIQKYYKKYAKIKRAQEWLRQQIEICHSEITYLETVHLSLEECSRQQEIEEIRQELMTSGYWKENRRQTPRSRPSEPRRIALSSGATIHIGRNNQQNDWVTFKLAQPKDLWFHTRNIPGSHLVLRSPDNRISSEDIKTAAMLAAWFSKARGSSNVPVDYTERRYVKKPSGAKPGFVIYEKQKTISVTPGPDQVSLWLPELSLSPG